jgi:hypothetical protein
MIFSEEVVILRETRHNKKENPPIELLQSFRNMSAKKSISKMLINALCTRRFRADKKNFQNA